MPPADGAEIVDTFDDLGRHANRSFADLSPQLPATSRLKHRTVPVL